MDELKIVAQCVGIIVGLINIYKFSRTLKRFFKKLSEKRKATSRKGRSSKKSKSQRGQ